MISAAKAQQRDLERQTEELQQMKVEKEKELSAIKACCDTKRAEVERAKANDARRMQVWKQVLSSATQTQVQRVHEWREELQRMRDTLSTKPRSIQKTVADASHTLAAAGQSEVDDRRGAARKAEQNLRKCQSQTATVKGV